MPKVCTGKLIPLTPDMGLVLREERTRRQFKQSQLAQRAGMSTSAIGSIENAATPKTGETTLSKLLTALGRDRDWLDAEVDRRRTTSVEVIPARPCATAPETPKGKMTVADLFQGMRHIFREELTQAIGGQEITDELEQHRQIMAKLAPTIALVPELATLPVYQNFIAENA